MRPTLFRRLVAGLVGFAFIATLGLQGMQAAAMVTMKSDMSMSIQASAAMSSDDGYSKCANCEGSGQAAAMQCQPVSICTPVVAVLPTTEPISVAGEPARFEAENVSIDGRTGTPELHPPKSAVLL